MEGKKHTQKNAIITSLLNWLYLLSGCTHRHSQQQCTGFPFLPVLTNTAQGYLFPLHQIRHPGQNNYHRVSPIWFTRQERDRFERGLRYPKCNVRISGRSYFRARCGTVETPVCFDSQIVVFSAGKPFFFFFFGWLAYRTYETMAEGETESPGPKKRGPYISSVTSRSVNLIIRGVVLFFIGVFLALVLNLLQIQRNVTLFPPDVIASIFSSAWWVPPCCGTASAVIGLLYPCIDRHLGEPHKFKREWSSVMRCVAVFVGINHASAKVDFDNNIQLSLTLAALSIGLWWTFDRSRTGFGLGVGIAFLATLVTQLLVYNGVYQYTSPDFLYVRSWLPCIFFAGGITMGNIGRQLAMVS
uniref:Insulin-induced gene protein n=1 Tax=Molossus molossus TaxID=27622 RepID=A0A7J8FRP9_MOLMO|nr:insulin induced protein 2 [Molossus molossus]